MKHVVWKNQEAADYDVHFKGDAEFTLCGLAYEGMDMDKYDCTQDFREVGDKVTCESCIEIVKKCKNVNSIEIDKEV